jgi:hypothetical protein
VTMQLGTPPQNVTLLLDSGSSLLWVQCNDCADCTGLTEVIMSLLEALFLFSEDNGIY